MLSSSGGRINSYALVAYIPPPLGRFLDLLRLELVPSCTPRAHVTVLPPRPLQAPAERAAEAVGGIARDTPPLLIELSRVEVFEVSGVVYVSIGEGEGGLRKLHERFNTGVVRGPEVFGYHPHVTLAQDIGPDRLEEFRGRAQHRWAGYEGERSFLAEEVVFVQATTTCQWVDLAAYPLGVAQPVR